MTNEERIDRLEDAHRALAAQHLALQTTCRILLPLLMTDADLARNALLTAYDLSSLVMDDHQMDESFQRDMRRWLDIFSEDILSRPRQSALSSDRRSA